MMHTRPARLRRAFRAATAILLACGILLTPIWGFSADIPIATVAVGRSPAAIGVNPVTHRIYVANYNSHNVSIINGVTDSRLATVAMPASSGSAFPDAIVVNSLSTPPRAYVGNFWSGRLAVIDESSNTLTATIVSGGAHGGGPRALAIDPGAATPKVFVAEYGTDSLGIFNATTHALIARVPVGDSPRALGIFVSAPRRRVFVANRGTHNVTIINGATNSVVATVATGVAPKAIAVDTSTGYAYVTNETSDTVAVIDATDSVTARVKVGDRPIGIAVDPVGGRVFVANFSSNNVTVLRTSDNTIEATISVGTNPWGIAFNQTDRKAFITNYNSANVSIIDSALSLTTCTVGTNPYAIAADEGAAPVKVYCGNYNSQNVTVIDEPAPPVGMAPMGVSLAYASAPPAAASPVAVTIDPLPSDSTATGTVTLTGGAESSRPIPAAVVAVMYRVDGGAWKHTLITSGSGTERVTWSARLTGLGGGGHVVEALAFDETGAAASTSEMGSGAGVASIGGRGSYAFRSTLKPRVGTTSTWNGVPGAAVTITGSGFGDTQGDGYVTFAGVRAAVTAWSDTAVTALVPSGAGPGYVGVWKGGVCSNGLYFVPAAIPRLNALSASMAETGFPVTLTGTGFGASRGSGRVTFGGVTADIVSWSDTTIIANVPVGAKAGYVGVWQAGICSNGRFFVPGSPPRIASMSHKTASVGTVVTITGTGFGPTAGRIALAGTTITPLTWSDTQITFVVPAGLAPGYLGVWRGAYCSNGVWFSPAPRMVSISPSFGSVGTTVTVTGTGFGATQGDGKVTFSGVSAGIVSWSDTQVVVTVPATATSGYVGVWRYKVASNGLGFVVTP